MNEVLLCKTESLVRFAKASIAVLIAEGFEQTPNTKGDLLRMSYFLHCYAMWKQPITLVTYHSGSGIYIGKNHSFPSENVIIIIIIIIK